MYDFSRKAQGFDRLFRKVSMGNDAQDQRGCQMTKQTRNFRQQVKLNQAVSALVKLKAMDLNNLPENVFKFQVLKAIESRELEIALLQGGN
jgi:hypothetical protein